MESLRQKHERRMREERDGATKLQLAQIADNRSYVETLQDKKFTKTRYRSGISTNPNVILPRYKVRILGVHGEDVQPPALPWAYPKFAMSGLRGESQGNPVYPVNTLVDVTQDPKTNNYYIERIHPNTVGNLADDRNSSENRAASGFGVGADTNLYSVPETGISFGTGSASKLGIAPGFEEYSVSVPSIWDNKQNSPRDDAKWQFPTLDGAKNTVGGMSSALENSIKDVERIKNLYSSIGFNFAKVESKVCPKDIITGGKSEFNCVPSTSIPLGKYSEPVRWPWASATEL